MDVAPFFHSLRYLRSNARRTEFLASLGLPVEGRTVLDVGAGVGDLTHFFLDRNCAVTCVEPREENVTAMRARYADDPLWPSERMRIVQSDIAHLREHDVAPHDVLFCFGVLNELADPQGALAVLAPYCHSMMLLEVAVQSGEHRHAECLTVHDVVKEDLRASIEGRGCVPSRRWVRERLSRDFPHVYMTLTQPHFDRYGLFWREPSAGAQKHRVLFVASREPIVHPYLVEAIPDFQYREYREAGPPAPYAFEALLALVPTGALIYDLDPGRGRFTVPLAAAAGARGRLVATVPSRDDAVIVRRNVDLHDLANVTIVPADVRTGDAFRALHHTCGGGRIDLVRMHADRLHALLDETLARSLAKERTLLFVEGPAPTLADATIVTTGCDFTIYTLTTRD